MLIGITEARRAIRLGDLLRTGIQVRETKLYEREIEIWERRENERKCRDFARS